MPVPPSLNVLTSKIIACAIAVHSALGPGLLESVYVECLILELRHAGLRVDADVYFPIVYRGITLECMDKIDLLVEGVTFSSSRPSRQFFQSTRRSC